MSTTPVPITLFTAGDKCRGRRYTTIRWRRSVRRIYGGLGPMVGSYVRGHTHPQRPFAVVFTSESECFAKRLVFITLIPHTSTWTEFCFKRVQNLMVRSTDHGDNNSRTFYNDKLVWKPICDCWKSHFSNPSKTCTVNMKFPVIIWCAWYCRVHMHTRTTHTQQLLSSQN